jgi:hypothetical protein
VVTQTAPATFSVTNVKSLTVQCEGQPDEMLELHDIGNFWLELPCKCQVHADGKFLFTSPFPCIQQIHQLVLERQIPAALFNATISTTGTDQAILEFANHQKLREVLMSHWRETKSIKMHEQVMGMNETLTLLKVANAPKLHDFSNFGLTTTMYYWILGLTAAVAIHFIYTCFSIFTLKYTKRRVNFISRKPADRHVNIVKNKNGSSTGLMNGTYKAVSQKDDLAPIYADVFVQVSMEQLRALYPFIKHLMQKQGWEDKY